MLIFDQSIEITVCSSSGPFRSALYNVSEQTAVHIYVEHDDQNEAFMNRFKQRNLREKKNLSRQAMSLGHQGQCLWSYFLPLSIHDFIRMMCKYQQYIQGYTFKFHTLDFFLHHKLFLLISSLSADCMEPFIFQIYTSTADIIADKKSHRVNDL